MTYPTAAQAQQAYYANGTVAPMASRMQGICVMVHGWPKQGKSCFCDSGPTPTIIVDVEGTSRWTPRRKTYWDPQRQTVPQPPDMRMTSGPGTAISHTPEWESCIALVRDYKDAFAIRKVMDSGLHPFNSLDMDGITEFQARVIDTLAGSTMRKLEWPDWDALRRYVNGLTRGFKDLLNNPVKQLWTVSFTAGTHWDDKVKKWRPLLQGSSADLVPYHPDIEGWLQAQPDGSRHLLIGPHTDYETGERIGNRLPYSIPLAYPGWPGWTLTDMLTQVLSYEGTR